MEITVNAEYIRMNYGDPNLYKVFYENNIITRSAIDYAINNGLENIIEDMVYCGLELTDEDVDKIALAELSDITDKLLINGSKLSDYTINYIRRYGSDNMKNVIRKYYD